MKKTLLALCMTSLAATSAQAYTFDIQETGTKIDFSGSARVKWESVSNKYTEADGSVSKNHENQAVDNNGSRFGFKITQNLGDDFYALGRVEWRFRDTNNHQHNFGHIYARQLYAGFGHKQFGELVYGNMTTITDEVKQTDLANTYSLSDGLLNSASRRVVQYTYKGIDDLKLGAYYGGASKRNNRNLDLTNRRKSVWGGAAIYKYEIDDLQSITVGTGVSRETFANADESSYHETAYALDMAYKYDKTTFGVDLERAVTKDRQRTRNGVTTTPKRVKEEVRTVLHHEITDDWNAYTMYAYKTDKLDGRAKEKRNEFMLGTEYYLLKQDSFKIKPFIEWAAIRTKNPDYEANAKSRDYKTVIGLRAYW
ncbi:porin [Aggregatibacter actinomycetemcomitans]|nr:porin [Aggregatibacter actinomycetemcomitans]